MTKLIVLSLLLFGSQAYALECLHIHPIMVKIMTNHVSGAKFNKDLETRTIDQYIKRLDGGKLYLTQDDVNEVKAKLKSFYTDVRKRDCSFIDEIQKIYLSKLEERAKFAETYIKLVKDINKELSISLDPNNREYAKTTKELNDFQERHIHFQLANILVTDVDLKEAKEMLTRRYTRVVKQTKEQTKVDQYTDFIESFAHSLDPHTSYLSKKMFEDFQINMSLSLEGIGATLSSQDGYTVVEQLVPGGAAAKSGVLESQDKILAVAQGSKGKFVPIYDMNLSDVVRLIRGKRKTQVRLKVLRKSGNDTSRFEVSLVREKINLEEEAAQISYVERKVGEETKKIGVLSLPSFYADNTIGGRSSANDVKKLLIEASKNNVDALVLDFASNGGGDLDSAVKIGGMFFKTGNVVSHENMKLMDIDPSVYYNGPLVVNINRLSASASEIVAGALQDYKRAVIVGGDHTFGKGSVQQVMRLSPELGSIKFTVGLFYLPGGKSTQHSGVSSDIVFPSPLNSEDIGEKSLDYSLPPNTIKPFVSKSAFSSEGETAWTPLNDETIKSLRKKSLERIAKNEEFKKKEKEIEEAKAKGKEIKIAEILSEKNTEALEKRKKLRAMTKDDRRKEYIDSPEIQEAVNIALDLAQHLNQTIAKK